MSEERKMKCCAGRASWLVIGSVALNLFLVGVLSGPYLGHHPMEDGRGRGFGPPPEPGFIFEQVAQNLPQEEAQKLRAIFEGERGHMMKHRQDMHKNMEEIASLLMAETPDLNALHEALARIRGMGQGMQEGMARTFERMATELSLPSRQKIAEKIKKPFAGNGPQDGAPRNRVGGPYEPRPSAP